MGKNEEEGKKEKRERGGEWGRRRNSGKAKRFGSRDKTGGKFDPVESLQYFEPGFFPVLSRKVDSRPSPGRRDDDQQICHPRSLFSKHHHSSPTLHTHSLCL